MQLRAISLSCCKLILDGAHFQLLREIHQASSQCQFKLLPKSFRTSFALSRIVCSLRFASVLLTTLLRSHNVSHSFSPKFDLKELPKSLRVPRAAGNLAEDGENFAWFLIWAVRLLWKGTWRVMDRQSPFQQQRRHMCQGQNPALPSTAWAQGI